MLLVVLLIFSDTAEEGVVGVNGRTLIAEIEQADSSAPYEIVMYVLLKLLVIASMPFLQHTHRYEDADLLCGCTHVTLRKERTEYLLVNVAGYIGIELVEP